MHLRCSRFERIKGLNTTTLIDDNTYSFNGWLIDDGVYPYITVLGAKSTIASFIFKKGKEWHSLTKEEFAGAINNGFELPDNVK